MVTKIYKLHTVPLFCQFYNKVVLRLDEHDDIIETQTKICPPQTFFANSVPDHHISRLLCFAPWMISLSLVIDFDNIRATLCIIYARFVLFCCVFCSCRSVAVVPIWRTWCVDLRFRCCIQCCWWVPEVLYEMLAMQCIRLCISVWFLVFLALYFETSTWHDKIQRRI